MASYAPLLHLFLDETFAFCAGVTRHVLHCATPWTGTVPASTWCNASCPNMCCGMPCGLPPPPACCDATSLYRQCTQGRVKTWVGVGFRHHWCCNPPSGRGGTGELPGGDLFCPRARAGTGERRTGSFCELELGLGKFVLQGLGLGKLAHLMRAEELGLRSCN